MPEENPRRRKSGLSLIIGLIVLVLLAGGGYYAWQNYMPAAPVEETPQQQPTPTQPTVLQYSSSTMKVAVAYSQEFTLQEPYAYTRVSPTKPISGVKFVVPTSLTAGTNLAPDSGVSIEQLPRATVCTGDIFVKANVKAQNVPSGGMTFSVATSSETVGNDLFEEVVFAVPSTTPCVAMRYFVHSTVGMATGTRLFDGTAVINAFDAIRASFRVQ